MALGDASWAGREIYFHQSPSATSREWLCVYRLLPRVVIERPPREGHDKEVPFAVKLEMFRLRYRPRFGMPQPRGRRESYHAQ